MDNSGIDLSREQLIKRLDDTEKEIKEIVFRLSSANESTFEDLERLHHLLQNEFIMVLEMLLKELQSFQLAPREIGRFEDSLRKYIDRLKRCDSRLDDLINQINAPHDIFYQEHPWWVKRLARIITLVRGELIKNIREEEKAALRESKRILSRTQLRPQFSTSGRVAAALTLAFLALTVDVNAAEAKQNLYYHKIKEGQHIGVICKKYEAVASYSEILAANPGVDMAHLKLGQVIKIPGKEGVDFPKQEKNEYHNETGDFASEKAEVVLARAMFGEALGCNKTSKKALAAVVLFRKWSPDFPNNIKDIILANGQFHCFRTNSAVYPKVKDPETYAPKEWQECLDIAKLAVTKKFQSPIYPAFYYIDSSITQLKDPYVFVQSVANGKPDGSFHFYVSKNNRLAAHFKVNEFLFPGCTAIRVYPKLIQKLEELRNKEGKSIKVEGIRKKGTILLLDAVDITVNGLTEEEMKDLAAKEKYTFAEGRIHIQVEGEQVKSNIDPDTGEEIGKQPEEPIAGNPRATMTFPLKTFTRISTPYGGRIHPITKQPQFHKGIDIVAPTGTPIFSVSKGKVLAVNSSSKTAGMLVVIDHQNGYMSEYMHMSKIHVKMGQEVTSETKIGRVGSTGRSTGPHLHIGIFKGKGWKGYKARNKKEGGKFVNYVKPNLKDR